ncbi:hypothetical protein [Vibrio chagasii]|uniref:hypothetical protein n=1 Tax=Vibrio chagasii TaxID=170679 RepID=UPI003DA01514
MNIMTHEITTGLKAGLAVRIVRDGAWMQVADIDGTEHKVRRKQLAELTGDTTDHIDADPLYVVDPISSDPTESHGDASPSMPDIDHDPMDDADAVRMMAEEAECLSDQGEAEEDGDTNPKSMSGAFRERRAKYSLTDGCGDDLQMFLKGFAPTDVIAMAESLGGFADGELFAKYEHLNNGQKRMNAGNRIRSLVKKGTKTLDDVQQAADAL